MPNDELSAFARVSRIIEDCHVEFRRVATSQLAMLFWNIGNKINASTQAHESSLTAATGWRKLLCDAYGTYFNESSLNSMQAFAAQHPTMQEAALVSWATDWAHIKILVDVSDDLIRQHLTSQMLRTQMSAPALAELKHNMQSDKASAIPKARKNQTSSLLRSALRQNTHRENPLQGNILHDPDFLSFFEVLSNAGKPDHQHKKPDAAASALIKSIDLEIAIYLQSFNYLLGVFTAQSSSHIGHELLRSFEGNKDLFSDFQAFLDGFSAYFEAETGIRGVSAMLQTLELTQNLQQPHRPNKQSAIVKAEPIYLNPDEDIHVISRKINDILKTPLFQLLR